MTYVPDYVRSVGPKSPPSLPTTPTSSNHTRRLPSLSGSSKSTTSNGRERSNSQHSEESTSSTSSRRRSASNPVFTPRPYKAPQDRLCSRVSIKDRLKSLETGAAVKLELRQTALRGKRRSLNYGTNRPLQATPVGKDRHSADSSSISSVSSIRSNRENAERVGEGASSMPKPDIIASNQPKEAAESSKPSEKDSAENCQTDEKIQSVIANAKSNGDVKQKRKSSLRNAKTEHENVSKQHHAVQSNNNNEAFPVMKDNSEKQKRENRHNTRRTSEPDTTYCSSDRVSEYITPKLASQTVSDASSADERSKPERSRAKSTENLNDAKEKNAPGSGFKPIWRTPSLKQAQKTKRDRLSSYVNDEKKEAEKTDKSTSFEPEEKKNSAVLPEVAPSLERNQEPSGATKEPGTPKTESLEEEDGSELVKEPATIEANSTTTQAAVNTTSYPVELRSPRHEHSGQASRRPGARDKRNARMFIMPSSSDSDMDNNQVTRMERDFATKLGLSRAVDLLPDSNQAATTGEDANHNNVQKTPELTIKHVTPVKFVPNVLKANQDAKTEVKRDSIDQSSKIYPELLTPSRGSRRDSKNRDGDMKKDTQKSPNRRRRSTRSSRAGYNRSKSTDARRAGHDVQRNRSNSMCDPKRMQQGQEAVANAVIFGHSTGPSIPYIDDVTSPSDEAITGHRHPTARRLSATTDQRAGDLGTIHRSSSADVLSSLKKEVSPPKMRRVRASSVDRSAAKGVHRRSYQIATMALNGDPERQKNIEKFNKLLLNVDQNGDRSRDLGMEEQDSMTRSGYLHFKVATIDKGKRTSSQKSWKQVWATIKDQQLCLTKDFNKTKNVQDSPIDRQLSTQEEIYSLNVQSSLVGIAYNYLKRRNVFKLTTFNGSEYLFQAENRNDMLAWIAAIQKQSYMWEDGTEAEDLILRKTSQIDTIPKSDKRSTRKRSPKPSQKNNLQVKDVDGSRRFKWRGSVNKIVKKFGTGQPFVLNGTFGVHLEDCPPSPVNEFVPFIVELCCRVVEDRGLRVTGIYRVPGNNASLSALQEDLNNRGAESIQPDDERLRDLNIVSSLLKSFFRKLPEPLFTNELYHDFIQANRQQTPENRLNCLRKLVHMLPGPHYETLKFLISHLRLIADNCEWNKMEVRNLAIVFGPTLVRNTAADNTATMVTDMSDQCRIIESIIDHAEWFFSDTVDTIPEIAQSVPAEGEREAVPSIEFLLDNVGRKPGDTGTTESGKSKGSDDSENSFSRDLMDLLFGKKWKQSTNANNQSADVDDDGGFGDYRSKKQDGPAPKKEQVVPGDVVVTEAESPKVTQDSQPQQSSIPNVTERLMDFYREHLERLSQTTVGQTLPTFSSADSSPRTTPRHSTVFTAPLIFPPQDNIPRGNRSRVSSDSQDPRYLPPAYEMPPKVPPHANRIPAPEVVSRSISAPQYKHPPNPYRPGRDSFNPKLPVSESPPSSSLPAVTRQRHDVVPKPRENIAKTVPRDPPSSPTRKKTSSKPSSRKPSHSENIPYVDEHMQHYPQIEPSVTTKDMPVDMVIDENCPPVTINERLVDELPQPVYTTSPISLRSRKSSSTSPEPPVSKSRPAARSHSKKSSAGSVEAIKERPVKKRHKSPLKENFSPPLVTTASASNKLFSRYDPKRRGIRFAGTENDQLHFIQNVTANTSPKKQQLSATERLFNGQPLRRKPSSRENRRNKVIRRHTLSGIQDLQEHSPSLKFKSNLQQASMGQNLSMYDLASASANGQRSAMERLNPKGATSGLTLSNWIRQERMRSKTAESNGSPGNSIRRQKEQGQFRSYV